MSQTSFAKRQREKERQEKNAAKAARRAERAAASAEAVEEAPRPAVDEDALIAELAKLHALYDDEQIDLDELEERKALIMAKLVG